MRVVRVQTRICVGGPALHCILLAEGMSRRAGSRYETTLIGGALEPGEASMTSFARERGVEIVELPEMRRPVRPVDDAKAVARLASILRRVRPHIVHTHTAKAGAVGRLAARLAGVPRVLHTFHGHVFEGYFSARKADLFVRTERALARRTDRILALSEEQKRDLVERYRIAPEHKVQVVPLGLDLTRFRAVEGPNGAFRRELGLSEGAPLAVGVGRMVPIKRFDRLIDAFVTAAERIGGADLALVGDGEARAALEAHARLRRTDRARIHFVGMRRDLPAIYGDADVVALSSDNEGTPVAVIEALTSGTPVVATDVGGVRAIVRHPDLGTVVPRSDEALGDALSLHLAQPRRIEAALRDDVNRRYSHRRLLDDMEGIYDRLVDSAPLDVPRRLALGGM